MSRFKVSKKVAHDVLYSTEVEANDKKEVEDKINAGDKTIGWKTVGESDTIKISVRKCKEK